MLLRAGSTAAGRLSVQMLEEGVGLKEPDCWNEWWARREWPARMLGGGTYVSVPLPIFLRNGSLALFFYCTNR